MRTNTRQSPRLGVELLEDRAVPATFFVSNLGSDSAAGASDSPWKTLQYAADHVRAGDTVVVRAGTYAGFYMTADGTASSRITFSAESGAKVTSGSAARPGDGINLEGADYVTVEGFTVTGVSRAGIRSVTNTGVVIRNNTCDQNGTWGIFSGFSENLTVENNTTSRSKTQHGIYVSNSADNPVIRGNVSWGNYGCGIHMNGDVSMGGDGIISGALVENNVLYSNGAGGGSSINADGVQNSVFRNNLIYDAKASGISLFQIDGGGASSGNLVVNNTVLVASTGRWALNISDGAKNTTILNNILYSAHSARGAISITADSLSGLVSNYNITENVLSTDGGGSAIALSAWRTATGEDANSFTTSDPSTLFASPSTGDYHLSSTSAAVDKGTSTSAPAKDFEGDARPSGSGVDIGHDEYATSPSVPSVSVNDLSKNEGNPVNGVNSSTAFTFTITLSKASASSVTVNYSTADGTAAAGSDYTAASGSVTFAAGDTSKTVTVYVTGDGTVESDETFSFKLTGATGATLSQSSATGTILNDDSSGTSASASFVSTDSSTSGSWSGKYGSDGYSLSQGSSSSASYATFSVSGQQNYTWSGSTSDTRALQKPGATDRLAATWYSTTSFTVDVSITDGKTHRVSLYFLDWDKLGRSAKVEVLDGSTGSVLDTRTVSDFAGGKYLSWDLSGSVRFRVTNTGPSAAVLSGVFFGGASSSSGASASFVSTDSSTSGSWSGKYGSDGYSLSQGSSSSASYATFSVSGQQNYTWSGSTSDTRALQKPGATDRLAATWYSTTSFTVDVSITDGKTHRVSLYFLDWDKLGRSQTVEVLDGSTGSVLDTRTVSDFAGGKYLSWDLSGSVRFRITNTGPSAAVLSGVFFG